VANALRCHCQKAYRFGHDVRQERAGLQQHDCGTRQVEVQQVGPDGITRQARTGIAEQSSVFVDFHTLLVMFTAVLARQAAPAIILSAPNASIGHDGCHSTHHNSNESLL
jgi:hypothetical protein